MSERRRPGAVRGAAVLLALAAAVTLCAGPAAADPDTSRVVGGVRVSDRGIEIFEPGEARRVEVSTSGRDREVAGRVRVSVNGRETVTVRGPVVIVDSDDAGIVRVFADAYVEEGREVHGDVVAVFGSVRVDGAVSGSVVSVMGSVRLGPGASVSGDAVAVGGTLDLASGATVHGESVSIGFLPFTWGVPTLGVLLAAIGASVLITLLLGWLLFATLGGRMRRTAITVTRRTGSSLLLGLVSPPLVIITIGLLFITVVGIPGAFLLPLIYGVALFAGYIAASYVLGCKLIGRAVGEGGVMMPLTVGSLFVALFFVAGAALAAYPGWTRSAALFLSLAGSLLLLALAVVGSGAILVSRAGRRPADAATGSLGAGPPPPPYPAPPLSSAAS